jgi:hypothetical protein
MTPEQKIAATKWYRYMKQTGRGRLVDAGPVQEHVRRLHAAGMSCLQIAEISGIHHTRIRGIREGYGQHGHPLVNVRRSTHDAIMAVEFVPPEEYGARTDPTGTRRRLEALRADGFPVTLIAELAHMSLAQMRDLAYWRSSGKGRKRHFVYKRTADVIAEMYADTGLKTPEDFGASANLIARTKAFARQQGYAPRMAWDDDTIDDPNAFPEWTGACGTPYGHHLHYKRDLLPVCDPCRLARNEEKRRKAQESRENRT